MAEQIKSVRKKHRQAPLDDIKNLQTLALKASRQATKKARDAGVSVTYIDNGSLMQRKPDGSVTELKKIDRPRLSLDDILCQA